MGGIFSAPAPPPPPPPEPTTDPEAEARKERLKAIERRRRGRAGLVATSEAGVDETPSTEDRRLLAPASAASSKKLKTKFGE